MSLLLLLGRNSSGFAGPGSLSGLTQRFLDVTKTYYGSTVNNYPVLTPEESGTVAQPRGQRCALFDGVDDYASFSSITLTSDFTITAFLKVSAFNGMLFGGPTVNDYIWLSTSTHVVVTANAITSSILHGQTLPTGTWTHLTVVRQSGVITIYKDGIASGTTATNANTLVLSLMGKYAAGVFLSTYMRDVRVYNVAKSLAEVQAIYSQASTPSTIDRTGLLGMWSLQEESGTTAYDASGNGKHLTLTNITQGTFHATDTGVNWNLNNWKGHTVSGSVIIPQNLASPTLDAAGNSLGVAGPVAHPATVEVPCITGDGTGVYVNLGAVITGDYDCTFQMYGVTDAGQRTVFSIGVSQAAFVTSGVPTMQLYTAAATTTAVAFNENAWNTVRILRSSGLCTIYVNGTPSNTVSDSGISGSTSLMQFAGTQFFAGRVCDLRIETGGVAKRFPLQEGPGTGSTNRDLYWVASDGTSGVVSGAVTNGTVATIWANRCPYAQDHFINYGGRVASGVAIPGRLTGSLAADGNALTHAAGKHGNPYSRICPNTWSAPELVNIGSTSSTKLAPTDAVQSTSPVDTKFRRTKTDGDDRYFAVSTALTGSDKTNAEGYVA